MPDGPPEDNPLRRLVSAAARDIVRLTGAEALEATAAGALIIDLRSQDIRERDGVVPGSLHIPRTVLEWRVALESPWRNRHLGGADQPLILICDHGYSSILAASNLVALGFSRVGDVIGGYAAWVRAGLPTARCGPRPPADALPGSGPPEPA